MKTPVYWRCSFVTWPPVLALLFAGYVLCSLGFAVRSRELGLGHDIPDAQRWYTPEQLKQLLEDLGEKGRATYALTECTLDFLFPLIYGSLFAGLLAHVYPRYAARCLAVLPLVAMLADLSENFHFAHLACHFGEFDKQIQSWYWTAVISTATKVTCFALTTLALIVGGVGRLLRLWSGAA
jgi:hypothetical protein